MSSEALSHDEAIGQFCGVTGADEDRAKGLLEACGWNVELAINMHVDTEDGRVNRPTTTNSTAGPSTSSEVPVVDISDSIDDDEDLDGPSARPRRFAKGPSPTFCDNDNVRPPIPPVRQVLVQHPTSYPLQTARRGGSRYNSRPTGTHVYDAFRDFQAEAQWQEMVAQEGESSASDSSVANANKRSLQELFRPPLDIMFRGSLESAREVGTQQNKWLLVNIQNGTEFACQTLNRDVWSNQTVKDILKEHFIFWQVYHDSFEGTRYVQFYKVSGHPHVSIIDPRTGESMKSWPTSIDHNSFCDSVIEFLAEHPSPDGSTDSSTMKKLRVKEDDLKSTLYDQSEEAQLEAAIKASLQETDNSNSSKNYADEDSFTDTLESDNDQTQSSFQAHTSNSGPTFSRSRETKSNRGQSSSSSKDFHGFSNSMACKGVKAELVENIDDDEVVEDYKRYLGKETERFSDLVVRFPDGTRDQLKFPSDSLIKALFLLLTSRGYGMNRFNYVTNFPRRLLHELPSTDTLQDAKLIRETIFIERKANEDQPM